MRAHQSVKTLLLLLGLVAFVGTVHAQGNQHRRHKKPNDRVIRDTFVTMDRPGPIWRDYGALLNFLQEQGFMAHGSGELQPYLNLERNSVAVGIRFDEFEAELWADDGGDLRPILRPDIDTLLDLFAQRLLPELMVPGSLSPPQATRREVLGGPIACAVQISLKCDENVIPWDAYHRYKGEFQAFHNANGELRIPISLDDNDTLIQLVTGQSLSILEHASLRAFAVQTYLNAAIAKKYPAPDPNLPSEVRPGNPYPLFWHPIEIIINNPNQRPMTSIQLRMRCNRPSASDSSWQ